MNKISPFVRLDFYTLKPYIKSILLLLALAIAMTIAFQSLATLCFYLMIGLIMLMMYPFSIDETNKLDMLYATLSLKRKNIVVGRYVFALFMEIITVLLVLVFSYGFSVFTNIKLIVPELLFNLCLASFLFSTIVAIQYPIYFKLGYTKARFIAYMPLLIIFLIVILLPNVLISGVEDFMRLLTTIPFLTYCAPVIIGHLLFALSCCLSCKLYGQRNI